MQASVVQSPPSESLHAGVGCFLDSDPAAIRHTAATLVAKGKIDDAAELIAQALISMPDSEDLLVMHVLLCESRHLWLDASSALQHLVEIQGDQVTEETLCHWVRVLRCLGDWEAAALNVTKALVKYPSSCMLQSESETIGSVLSLGRPGRA